MAVLTGTSANGRRWIEGSGSPEGAVVGYRGDIYSRIDGAVGTSFYVKEANDGLATGWTAFAVTEDHLVMASPTDLTPGPLTGLGAKLVAGTNITLNLLPGPNEQVQIAASGGGGTPPALVDISAQCSLLNCTPQSVEVLSRVWGKQALIYFYVQGTNLTEVNYWQLRLPAGYEAFNGFGWVRGFACAAWGLNAGVGLPTPARAVITPGSRNVVMTRDFATGTWTIYSGAITATSGVLLYDLVP
jgi:hypothetical protein